MSSVVGFGMGANARGYETSEIVVNDYSTIGPVCDMLVTKFRSMGQLSGLDIITIDGTSSSSTS